MIDPIKVMNVPEIGIFVVAHTNVGKTTLIRTLLGQDVGEIVDWPDVTKALNSYDLVVDQNFGALRLWDTPGFGDSFRLAKRLRRKHRWIAWVVREIWDRFFNKKLWKGQRLALDLRARASVILYPVNLQERPVDAVYVAPELEVLAWVGKPVLAILNQGGGQYSQQPESQRAEEWTGHLSNFQVIRHVSTLDAYTRCWLQELNLFKEIGQVLPDKERDLYLELVTTLGQAYAKRFDDSVTAITDYLFHLANDKVELDARWFEGMKDIWDVLRKTIPWGRSKDMTPFELAMQGLAQRYAESTKKVTEELIHINRLNVEAATKILANAEMKPETDRPWDGGSSTIFGGVISGVLTGLGADLITGGLSLGTGALVGGALGAMSAAALAKGYNVYTKKNKKVVGWSADALTEAFGKSVMLYLSVAHFGRGQGPWRRKDEPKNWSSTLEEVLMRDRERLRDLWRNVGAGAGSLHEKVGCEAEVRHLLRRMLLRFYPESGAALPVEPARNAASTM